MPSLHALDQGSNLSKLFNHITNTLISSGDEIALTTEDPELQPLPDMRLLEMQYFLHRVAAMSGAADRPPFESDNYGDDEDGEEEGVLCSDNDWDME